MKPRRLNLPGFRFSHESVINVCYEEGYVYFLSEPSILEARFENIMQFLNNIFLGYLYGYSLLIYI